MMAGGIACAISNFTKILDQGAFPLAKRAAGVVLIGLCDVLGHFVVGLMVELGVLCVDSSRSRMITVGDNERCAVLKIH